MIIDELKKANIEAMKARKNNVRGILGIVISKYKLQEVELKAKGQEITDTDLLNIIQKTIKELDDEMNGYLEANRIEQAQLIKEQKEAISSYLPKQLNEEEIKEIIFKLDDKTIPSIMKHFKTNYNGQVDMGLVSKIARSI